MHPTAKKCLLWAICLIVVGCASYIFGLSIISSLFGMPETPLDRTLNLTFSTAVAIMQNAFVAIGGALVAGSVVINVLAPKPAEDSEYAEAEQTVD